MAGMVITAIVTYGILVFERAGFRMMEIIIATLVGTIGLCYVAELVIAPIAWGEAARGTFDPRVIDQGTIAYLITFDDGFRVMYRDSGGRVTDEEKSAMGSLGGVDARHLGRLGARHANYAVAHETVERLRAVGVGADHRDACCGAQGQRAVVRDEHDGLLGEPARFVALVSTVHA